MSITKSPTAGPFGDILCWPFKGTIQISVFRQDHSGLIWTNLLKTDDKTTPLFVRPTALQPNPIWGIFFYLPHAEMFKTQKNLMQNDNVYIQIKILDFPWSRVSISTIVIPGWDVVFNMQQKKEKKDFEKLELKTVTFYIRHFDCRCASSNMFNFCLHPLQNRRRQNTFTCRIWTSASSTKTIDSTPGIIMSSEVIWRHVYIPIMNTDDSQVMWLVTWLDVIVGANPVLLLFSLAPESTPFSRNSGRNLPLRGASFRLRSDFQRAVKSL